MKATELERGFSPGRVLLLLRNRLLEELPLVGIVWGVVLALNLIGLILAGTVPLNQDAGPAFPEGRGGLGWTSLVILTGLWLAARSLAPMHGKGATDWLLLPATGTEKYLAVLAWILVVWPLGATLGASLLSALLHVLAVFAGARGGTIWHPFDPAVLRLLPDYLAAAPILVAGSAFFRRHALIRTAGVLAGAASALLLLGTFTVWALFPEGIHEFSLRNGIIELPGDWKLERILQVLIDLWRYAVLPGFALAFGWFRVREKEARDAVQ